MESTLIHYENDATTMHGCTELLVDCLSLYDTPHVRLLHDGDFMDVYQRARHCFFRVLVCYYHLLALHELGSGVYAIEIGEKSSQPINLRTAYDNVRVLLSLYYRLMFFFQNELYRRNMSVVNGTGREELSANEHGWIFFDYTRWCHRYTLASEKDIILSLMDDVEKWNTDDVIYMGVMNTVLQECRRTMQLDGNVIVHITRPLGLSHTRYPTMDLLNYYDSRMRHRDGEVKYAGRVVQSLSLANAK